MQRIKIPKLPIYLFYIVVFVFFNQNRYYKFSFFYNMSTSYLSTIAEYNEKFGFEGVNPLINVVDFNETVQLKNETLSFGFYIIKLKNKYCGDIAYGHTHYDYTDGSIFCIAPGQEITIDLKEYEKPSSVCLLFHPNLIHGTELGMHILDRFPFFSYNSNEALYISEEEKQFFMESMNRIRQEIKQEATTHNKNLLRLNIELLLEYLLRLYDRQFESRSPLNKEATNKFQQQLHEYYIHQEDKEIVLPTVEHFANLSGYSAKYFSELVKKDTGKSAQDLITSYVLDVAVKKLQQQDSSIKEIAYELGFQYPQHFTRFFSKQMGCSPKEYKNKF